MTHSYLFLARTGRLTSDRLRYTRVLCVYSKFSCLFHIFFCHNVGLTARHIVLKMPCLHIQCALVYGHARNESMMVRPPLARQAVHSVIRKAAWSCHGHSTRDMRFWSWKLENRPWSSPPRSRLAPDLAPAASPDIIHLPR